MDKKIEKKRIEAVLKYLKEEKNMTQKYVASNIGTKNEKRFSDLKSGKATLSFREMADLKEKFNINPEYLMGMSPIMCVSDKDRYNLSYFFKKIKIVNENLYMSDELYEQLCKISSTYNTERDDNITNLNDICNREYPNSKSFIIKTKKIFEEQFSNEKNELEHLENKLKKTKRENQNLKKKIDGYNKKIEIEKRKLKKLGKEILNIDSSNPTFVIVTHKEDE